MQRLFDQPLLVKGVPAPPETSRLMLWVAGDVGEFRHELRPGRALRLPAGELRWEVAANTSTGVGQTRHLDRCEAMACLNPRL